MTGNGSVYDERDRRTFFALAWRNIGVHLELLRQWPRLAAQYRQALPRLASVQAWQHVFDHPETAGRDR